MKLKTYDERFPLRKNPRLSGYDYATPNYYFVTICTHQRQCLFWSGGRLNDIGKIVQRGIEQISDHFPKNQVEKFTIMPNHVHMILTVEPGGANLSVVVGSLKSYVTKEIHKIIPDVKVWQVSFHDHGIRNQKGYDQIWNYIETNPIRWMEDCFYEESVTR